MRALLGLGLLGSVAWAFHAEKPQFPAFLESTRAGAFVCTVVSVHDGDTLRCIERGPDGRALRVRLSGIDAREVDGSCAVGHPCASAPPEAATAALERLAGGQRLQCAPEGSTYGRRAAFCRNGSGVDLSCAMLASGTVALWPRYWQNHRCDE